MTNEGESRTRVGHGVGGQYALELYLPRFGREALPQAAARAGSAAEQLRRLGTPVFFLRSIFLPGDEICFLLFEGPSAEVVAETGRRAAIVFERVVEVEVMPDAGRGRTRPAEASAWTKRREVE